MQVFTFPALSSLIFSLYRTVPWQPLLREAAYLPVVYNAVEALMMMTSTAFVRNHPDYPLAVDHPALVAGLGTSSSRLTRRRDPRSSEL
jgi:hypothetical protein